MTAILAPIPQPVSFPGPPNPAASNPPLPPQQLANTSAQTSIGATFFPPSSDVLTGGDHTSFAQLGGTFLSSVLPTNQVPQVESVFNQTSTTSPTAQTGVGNDFVATYAPQIYAVVLNGLVANSAIPAVAVPASRATPDIANPPIAGDPTPVLPGLPPVPTAPPLDGTDQVIQALQPLAGSGAIFSAVPASPPTPAPPPPHTAAASTASTRKAA